MSIDSIVIKLTEDYPTEIENIRQIKMLCAEIDSGKDIKNNVERLQQICNDLYLISSTENLIELQVVINKYRYEHDVTDPREVLNIDKGKMFVQ